MISRVARRSRRRRRARFSVWHWAVGFLAALASFLYFSGNLALLVTLAIVVAAAVAYRLLRSTSRAVLRREVARLSPGQFEEYVAAAFRESGWSAQVTGGTGDQGADVIVTTRNGTRLVVQAKKYRNRVGNSAVQEIVAAKAIYDAQAAAVVTSGPGYTRGARELAHANGVALLTTSDLALLKSGQRPDLLLPLGR